MDFAQLTLPHESLEGLSPFEVLRGYAYVPHYDWAKRTREDGFQGLKDRVSRKDAQRLVKSLHDVQEIARASIKRQQDRMTVQANKHRREPDFGVGDWVIIRKKVSSTDRPSDKLDYPMTRNRTRSRKWSVTRTDWKFLKAGVEQTSSMRTAFAGTRTTH